MLSIGSGSVKWSQMLHFVCLYFFSLWYVQCPWKIHLCKSESAICYIHPPWHSCTCTFLPQKANVICRFISDCPEFCWSLHQPCSWLYFVCLNIPKGNCLFCWVFITPQLFHKHLRSNLATPWWSLSFNCSSVCYRETVHYVFPLRLTCTLYSGPL